MENFFVDGLAQREEFYSYGKLIFHFKTSTSILPNNYSIDWKEDALSGIITYKKVSETISFYEPGYTPNDLQKQLKSIQLDGHYLILETDNIFPHPFEYILRICDELKLAEWFEYSSNTEYCAEDLFDDMELLAGYLFPLIVNVMNRFVSSYNSLCPIRILSPISPSPYELEHPLIFKCPSSGKLYNDGFAFACWGNLSPSWSLGMSSREFILNFSDESMIELEQVFNGYKSIEPSLYEFSMAFHHFEKGLYRESLLSAYTAIEARIYSLYQEYGLRNSLSDKKLQKIWRSAVFMQRFDKLLMQCFSASLRIGSIDLWRRLENLYKARNRAIHMGVGICLEYSVGHLQTLIDIFQYIDEVRYPKSKQQEEKTKRKEESLPF